MDQVFFNINLNRSGELRQHRETERRTFRIIAVVFFGTVLILCFFLAFLCLDLNDKLANRKRMLLDIGKEIEAYQVSGEYLSARDLERLARISTDRIFWAKKLVALSENTSSRIAITHFSFKNDVLSLYGITRLDRNQKEFDLIDEFITELKTNEQINSDFPEVKFVKSRRDFEKDVEILGFQIDCIPAARGSEHGGKEGLE